MPKFGLVRILWDFEICRFCCRKCIYLSIFQTLQWSRFKNQTNWASFMKFGVDIPCAIPYGTFEGIFEIPIFSKLMDFFKALGLVLFRGLRWVQLTRLSQPFQWSKLNKIWSTSSLRPSLWTKWNLIFFSNLMAVFKARGLVIFRGLKTLHFSRLFQPFQWN